jgi:hypothetical protein
MTVAALASKIPKMCHSDDVLAPPRLYIVTCCTKRTGCDGGHLQKELTPCGEYSYC